MSSANDRIAEAIRKRAIRLERYSAGEREAILKLLDKLFGELRLRLVDSGIGGIRRTDYQMRRLTLLFEEIEATISSAYGDISDRMDGALRSLSEVEASWAMNAVNEGLGLKLLTMTPMISERIAAAASDVLIEGAPSREWWARQSVKLLDGFKDQMRKGYLQGETNRQLLSRLVGGVDASGNPVFDLSKGTKRGAEATIRTSVQAIANDARMRLYRENSDVIKGVTWISTLDTRTTPGCAARDGLMWDLNGKPMGHDMELIPPPAHWNCRSVLSPVTKSFRDLGIDSDEVPASTRASIDGQVPEKMTFEKWLAGKPDSYVETVFGPTRAKLWRQGKLSIRDMVDQRGNPLTLDQLRKDFPSLDLVPKTVPKATALSLDYIPNKENKKWAKEVLEKAPKEIQSVFSQLQPPPKYKEINGTSHADVWGEGISIGAEARKTKERYQHTFFHEMGHLVDARNRVKDEAVFLLSSAKSAPIAQGIAADKKLFTGKLTSAKRTKQQELLNAVDHTSKWYKNAEVSDIVCCMTGGRIKGYYGHTASYLKRRETGNAEVFANLFALKAQNKTEAFELIRTLFPETVKAFEKMLPELKGVKG